MTLADAILIQRHNYDTLLSKATPMDPALIAGIVPHNGVPVEVLFVPATVISGLAGQPANGCAMRYDGRYIIFISNAPSKAPSKLSKLAGPWLTRHLILHEYGHLCHGHVFEDDPPRFYQLRVDALSGVKIATDEFIEQEDVADGFAFHRLLAEAKQAGEAQLAAEIQSEIHARGLPNI